MTDKEMLDWVEKSVFNIRLQLNDTYLVDYYEGDGTHKEAQGVSLRDCIQKANPYIPQPDENVFEFNGVQLKTVVSKVGHLCTGCDFYPNDCDKVNNYLIDTLGRSCADNLPHWHVMFVHENDKHEFFKD